MTRESSPRSIARRLLSAPGAGAAAAGIAILCAAPGARLPAAASPAASLSSAVGLLGVAPRDLPEEVRRRYRLGPDRRILRALDETARLLGAAASPRAEARFEAGRWRILAGGQPVGTISEFPGFEEATKLLADRARRLLPAGTAASRVASPPAGAGGAVTELDRAVRRLEPGAILAASNLGMPGGAGALDGATIRSVLSAAAWLAVTTADELDRGDPLLETAWAWLAVARARGMEHDGRAEALIPWALGYEADALRAAGRLPKDDPVRLFVAGRERELASSSAKNPTDPQLRFLRLAMLADRQEVQRYRAAAGAADEGHRRSLPELGLEVRLQDFDRSTGAGRDLATAVLAEVQRCAGSAAPVGRGSAASTEARSRDFEAAVDGCSRRFSGGPLGSSAVAAMYRADFYSGLFDEARFLVQRLASAPAALGFAAALDDPAEGTADQLRQWITVSAAELRGARDARETTRFLESADALGDAVLLDAARTIASSTASTDPLRRLPMPAVFRRLDTRPTDRVVAARIAARNLNSPWQFERFAVAAVEAAPHRSEELPAVVAEMGEDAAQLRAIVDDAAMPSYARVVALDGLSKLGKANDDFVRKRYERLAHDPDEGESPLVAFLESRDDLAGARAAVESLLRDEKDVGSLRWAHLRSEAARLALKAGDAEGAWTEVEPAVSSEKEEVLLVAARVELARHRVAHALELGRACLERYPDSSEASSLVAWARWADGEDAKAAQEIAGNRNGLLGYWNRYLPEAFAAAFGKASREDARRALAAMVAAGIPPQDLARSAIVLGREGELDEGLSLLESLPPAPPQWRTKLALDGYDLIREKKGPAEAASWFRSRTSHSHDDALTLYQERRFELLLAVYPAGDESDAPRIVRVLKAAALLHLGETRGPRWSTLVGEVERERGDGGFFLRAARYLLGLADDASVLVPLREASDVTDLGWVMGVKAASERRFEDAEDWFQVALESGQQTQPPHAWSWRVESDWSVARRSLELRQKSGDF